MRPPKAMVSGLCAGAVVMLCAMLSPAGNAVGQGPDGAAKAPPQGKKDKYPAAPQRVNAQANPTDVPPVEVEVKLVDVVPPKGDVAGTATALITIRPHALAGPLTLSLNLAGLLRADRLEVNGFRRAAPLQNTLLDEKTNERYTLELGGVGPGNEKQFPCKVKFTGTGRGVVVANVTAPGVGGRTSIAETGHDLLLTEKGKVYVNGKTFMDLRIKQLRNGEGSFAPGVPIDEQIEALQSGGAETTTEPEADNQPAAPEVPNPDGKAKEAPRAGRDAEKRDLAADAAAPAAAGRSVTATGTIQFTAINDVVWPVRFVRVELWSAGMMKASGTTDEKGEYTLTIADAGAPGTEVNVSLVAAAIGETVRVVNPAAPAGLRAEHAVRSKVVSIPVGQSKSIGLRMKKSYDIPSNVAFEIYEAANYISRYMPIIGEPLPGHDPTGTTVDPRVNINYPGDKNFSYYDNLGTINLHVYDVHDWDVVMHEYGHHLQLLYGTSNSPGGPHGIGENLCTTRGKDDGVRVAWGEGWPTFFGTQVQVAQGLSSLNIPTVGDTRYTNTKLGTQSLDYDLNESENPRSTGEGDEVAVQRVLWYLFYADHGVSLSPHEIFRLVADKRAVKLSEFWNALVSAHPKPIAGVTFGSILTEHWVGPVPMTPDDGFVYHGPGSPTFTWTTGNPGCETTTSSLYSLRVYSDDFGTLLLETEFQRATQFTPNAEQLAKIFPGPHNGRVHWVVVEQGEKTPRTGIYLGRPRIIDDQSH